MAMRNREKGEAAIEKLQEDTGKTAIFLQLDLADLKSVKAASEEFLRCVYCVIEVRPYVYLTALVWVAKRRNCTSFSTMGLLTPSITLRGNVESVF